MAYFGIVTTLKEVRKHPNADRLQIASCFGLPVIVGMDQKEGDLGIFFADDGCLSFEMCHNNNLFAHQEKNKDSNKKGYFDDRGRVRVQSLRGEKSYGFWTPLESLSWTGVSLSDLKEGDRIQSLNGKQICRKFINIKNKRSSNSSNSSKKKKVNSIKKALKLSLKEHYNTEHLRYSLKQIHPGDLVYLSLKLHGTSGRTGLVKFTPLLSEKKRKWNQYMGWLYKFESPTYWQLLTGTRRVVIDPSEVSYSGKRYRLKIHEMFQSLGIPKGMTFYYEIVGYEDDGKPIQAHSVEKTKDKKLRKEIEKLYGKRIHYTYGVQNPHQAKFFIYRITVTMENQLGTSTEIDLSWNEIYRICNSLGLETVPVVDKFIYDGNEDALIKKCEKYHDVPSIMDSRHPEEGVCIRVESPRGIKIYKDKSWLFRALEGFTKDAGETNIEEEEDNEDSDNASKELEETPEYF